MSQIESSLSPSFLVNYLNPAYMSFIYYTNETFYLFLAFSLFIILLLFSIIF